MTDIQTLVADLHKRVARLEQGQARKARVTNQKGAAEYISKSREWLRQAHLKGAGPRRKADGTYDYSALDDYLDNPGPESAA